MAAKDKIREALGALDPASEDDWTEDGLPVISSVAALVDDKKLTRAQITEAAPGFTRTHRSFDVATAETPADPAPTAPVADAKPAPTREEYQKSIDAIDGEIAQYRSQMAGLNKKILGLQAQRDAIVIERQAKFPPITYAQQVKATHAATSGNRSKVDELLAIRKQAARPQFSQPTGTPA